MRMIALIAVTLSLGCAGFALADGDPGPAQNRSSSGGEASRKATLDMIERDDGTPSILRVTFPLGMQIQYGTRMIVEGLAPLRSPFVVCTDAGCTSDYEITPALLDGMRSRQALIVQAIDRSGKPLTVGLRLGDFWETHHAWQVFAVKIPDERPKP
jgi:invasion protein IalB